MKFAFILFSLFATSAFSHSLDSIRAEQREEGLFVIHEVEEKETLFSIAKRYRSSVPTIVKYNDIIDNRIEIGQILSVLVEDRKEQPNEKIYFSENVHVVRNGETLYSISRRYDMKLRELKKLNGLRGTNISEGQVLLLSNEKSVESPERKIPSVDEPTAEEIEPDPEKTTGDEMVFNTDMIATSDVIEADFKKYLVQTGETLISIAKKFNVNLDQLRNWNNLTSDYLKIGQELLIKKAPYSVKTFEKDGLRVETKIDEDGFERIYEEGIASVIENINTTKFLALHRSLPMGTELAVRNLMNNLVVHVKVVGKLPDTGINRGIMLRLSSPAYERLGILDPKSRVEISYYKE